MKKIIAGLVATKLAFLIVLLSLTFSSCQTAQLSAVEITPTPTPSAETNDNINRPRSEPYAGDLSIFEDPQRAENLQIDRVMKILNISDGKNVADIGAGSGWFTVRAAKKVGISGKVYAVEINQDYIKHINDRAAQEKLSNIQTVFGTEDDPKLPDNSVDAVLILKTYHEIGQPIKVLEKVRKSLRKNALIGIIDRNGNGDDHGINQAVVVEELKKAGFTLANQYDFVKPDGMDYFLVFKMNN